MSALRELYYIAHATVVWFVWTVITGTPYHGRSYGELRRLDALALAKHLTPMVIVLVAVVPFFYLMPADFTVMFLLLWALCGTIGVVLVATTLAVTRFVDWRLVHS